MQRSFVGFLASAISQLLPHVQPANILENVTELQYVLASITETTWSKSHLNTLLMWLARRLDKPCVFFIDALDEFNNGHSERIVGLIEFLEQFQNSTQRGQIKYCVSSRPGS